MAKLSFMAHAARLYLRIRYHGRTEKRLRAEMQKRLKNGDRPYRFPKYLHLHVSLRETELRGCRVYRLNEGAKSGTVLLYLHGGGYVHEISPFHWMAIERMATEADCEAVVPLYPLAPNAAWNRAYALLDALYRDLRSDPDRKIVLMGDSAGGGLALALCEYFQKKGMRQPDRLILLSPWVDLFTDHPEIAAYAEKDLFLTPAVHVWGEYWANGRDRHDYRLSPIYGVPDGLHDVTVFYGTDEIFVPDMRRLEAFLSGQKNVRFFVGEGMSHVYPLFPIPEGRAALDACIRILREV